MAAVQNRVPADGLKFGHWVGNGRVRQAVWVGLERPPPARICASFCAGGTDGPRLRQQPSASLPDRRWSSAPTGSPGARSRPTTRGYPPFSRVRIGAPRGRPAPARKRCADDPVSTEQIGRSPSSVLSDRNVASIWQPPVRPHDLPVPAEPGGLTEQIRATPARPRLGPLPERRGRDHGALDTFGAPHPSSTSGSSAPTPAEPAFGTAPRPGGRLAGCADRRRRWRWRRCCRPTANGMALRMLGRTASPRWSNQDLDRVKALPPRRTSTGRVNVRGASASGVAGGVFPGAGTQLERRTRSQPFSSGRTPGIGAFGRSFAVPPLEGGLGRTRW